MKNDPIRLLSVSTKTTMDSKKLSGPNCSANDDLINNLGNVCYIGQS